MTVANFGQSLLCMQIWSNFCQNSSGILTGILVRHMKWGGTVEFPVVVVPVEILLGFLFARTLYYREITPYVRYVRRARERTRARLSLT